MAEFADAGMSRPVTDRARFGHLVPSKTSEHHEDTESPENDDAAFMYFF
jgi:hypothetical protein